MIKTSLSALALVASLGLASGASAAVIDFTSAGTGAGGALGGGLSYTTSATWTVPVLGTQTGAVTVSADGLGVNHLGDGQGGQIDGTPRFTAETLTVIFNGLVDLASFTLGRVDSNDDFEVSFDGGAFISYAAGFLNPVAGATGIMSFSIRASGFGSFGADGLLGNDDFTLAAAEVSAVPLPAGAPLLLAGLAGLAALRRRKQAA